MLRTIQPFQGNKSPTLSRPQFARLLLSDKEAHAVCQEFFRGSILLDDKVKIAEIAVKVRRFAVGRRHESSAQKFLVGSFVALGAVLTATAAYFKQPLLLLGWLPHAAITCMISHLATITRPYASKIPPIFSADRKICAEVQRYLEHEEFGEYRLSLEVKPQAPDEKPEYWYKSLVKTEFPKVN
jgi:hypothetical protein